MLSSPSFNLISTKQRNLSKALFSIVFIVFGNTTFVTVSISKLRVSLATLTTVSSPFFFGTIISVSVHVPMPTQAHVPSPLDLNSNPSLAFGLHPEKHRSIDKTIKTVRSIVDILLFIVYYPS